MYRSRPVANFAKRLFCGVSTTVTWTDIVPHSNPRQALPAGVVLPHTFSVGDDEQSAEPRLQEQIASWVWEVQGQEILKDPSLRALLRQAFGASLQWAKPFTPQIGIPFLTALGDRLPDRTRGCATARSRAVIEPRPLRYSRSTAPWAEHVVRVSPGASARRASCRAFGRRMPLALGALSSWKLLNVLGERRP